MTWIRRHANVSVVFSLVVALGLLAYVAYVGTARASAGQVWTIVQRTWLWVLVLTVPYLVARALVWYELLRELKIRVPFRQMAAAFAGGEMTKSLPAGVYVQNFLLGRLTHLSTHSTIRSTMATTATLGLESLLALPVALIIGIPGASWLTWTLLGVVAGWVVVLILAWLLVHYRSLHMGPNVAAWRQRIVHATEEFLQAGGELLSIKTAKNLPPTAVYMLIYAFDLYIILRAVGVHNVSFLQTMGIYALVVLSVILVPIPTELGITEFAGLGGLLAYGVPRSTAAIIMLSLRLLATGATILVAVVVLVLVRHELARVQAAAGTSTSDAPAGPG
ncbi:MAG: lysylphosphatidylglycerol synthase transmembrane domain-containing protein [Chloroflexota bacterium]|nr:MAG: hypothetical protein DLM70_12185 [Chloroflexota bacterium]